jgi:N-hydroxyarylamine O-acetyltransferase
MDVSAYLERIDYHGPTRPSAATLRSLHEQHLLTVPFENLDIHRGVPITCDLDRFYDKIVSRRRGGFCYELNGLFGALLLDLGFEVTTLSARVRNSEGEYGPEFDHMALLVRADEASWLADVGFGDSFLHPLNMDSFDPQTDPAGQFRLEADGGEWTMLHDGKPQYRFTLTPRALPEFVPMCHYQQTSPRSHFTRKTVCSRATRSGRVTVSDRRLIVTENGARSEVELSGDDAWQQALRDHFGITL